MGKKIEYWCPRKTIQGQKDIKLADKCSIGYFLNVMRQSACFVINPITVDGYAAFFNCTPVDRASDS